MHSDLESGGATLDRRLTAIAFVDIVGYSVLMAQDETATHSKWMGLLNHVLRPQAEAHRGTVVKSTGDGVLAKFPSALDAVKWGLDVQRHVEVESGDEDDPDSSIVFRIAVHVGDVVATTDDIYGDGVNLAARLLEHAEPGGIVLSEAVYDLVRGTLGPRAHDLGLLTLKNFEKPMRAFALITHSSSFGSRLRAQDARLPSIAVLPLRNLSDGSADQYFGEGVVEDIIVSLAGLRELLPISRTSTMTYAQKQVDVRDVGRTLGVRYVMTGSVRRSDRLVRVSVQLCDSQSGASLWADTSEVLPGDLFEVQDRIVTKIVAGIAPHVRSAELQRALRKRPDSFSAYDYMLKALAVINSLQLETFAKAREFLELAMTEDPNFAMAAAWAARWHSLNVGQGWSHDIAEDAARASELANHAIELDRQNAVALATFGHLRSFLFHDYDSALVYFERALAACPNSALALILSSGTLSYVGRTEEAVRNAERALRLSPFDQCLFYYYTFLGLAHYAAQSYQEAVKWTTMSSNENPRYTANLRFLIASLVAVDRPDEARKAVALLLRHEPEFTLSRYERTVQPFRDPDLKARLLGHLAAAGLPP